MICYHGTNIDTTELLTPIWVTTDYHFAGHFALNAKSHTIKSSYGYIYKIKVDDSYLLQKDKRRYILEGGEIQILDKIKVAYDRLTGFKKCK